MRRYERVLVVQVISVAIISLGGVAYTRFAVEANTRKICAIVVANDDTYHVTAPATEAGKQIAMRWSALRKEFGC